MSNVSATETVSQSQRIQFATPPVNVRQDAEGYILEAEVPGVAKDGVEVRVEDGRLYLTAYRKEAAGLGEPLYRETSAMAYRRVFDLDPSIDPSKITAKIDQGLLTVRLEKAEAVKPRKIAVA